MTVKYQIPCSGSDIYVLEREEGYRVTIGSRANPLSYGNKIASYETLGKAVDAADDFCKLYAAVKARGYHLDKDGAFSKEGMRTLSVTELLERRLTEEALDELLAKQP